VYSSDLDRPPAQGRRRRSYPLKWVVVLLAAMAVLLIGGPYFFFHVIEGKAPSRLQLPPVNGAAARAVAPGPVSGTWTVASGSQAGYRVHEILFGQSHTAVGRTDKVTGGAVISGTEVIAADFTVDVESIRSGQVSRDAQFDGYIMESYDYPNATFRLTEPIQLGEVPRVGQTVVRQAVGDLTMRGVTRLVSFTVSAERLPGAIDVNAEIPVTFSLWHIPNPSFAVTRVGSTGIVEVLLRLTPSSAP
jgi:polyisoprenoid-binding protein YceI